ncbi:MAG: phosphoribosyl-AMP cyclohydrolase [Fidelibacterota bacterium]
MKTIEETDELKLDFRKLKQIGMIEENVIPVVVQNVQTDEVVMVAYVNQMALDFTLKNHLATFWSTSRNELWVKGASSGDGLEVVGVRVNCDQNSLLYRVRLSKKNACHTHRPSCYYRKIKLNKLEYIHE